MNDRIDMPLSEHVAKTASQQINKLDKELNNNKDSYIYFLKDVVNDGKQHVRFLRKIICWLFIVNLLLIAGMVGLSMYHQYSINKQSKENDERFMKFLTENDFYYEVELLNEYSDNNTNNLNVTK